MSKLNRVGALEVLLLGAQSMQYAIEWTRPVHIALQVRLGADARVPSTNLLLSFSWEYPRSTFSNHVWIVRSDILVCTASGCCFIIASCHRLEGSPGTLTPSRTRGVLYYQGFSTPVPSRCPYYYLKLLVARGFQGTLAFFTW